MLFQLNLVIYICNRTAKKIHCFFSISFVCLFITLFYVPILLNMSIESFPALQECSRRLFWCFLRRKNLPDGRFCVSCAARTFPMTDFMFPALQECSRRPFWCFLRRKKNQNEQFCFFVKRKIYFLDQQPSKIFLILTLKTKKWNKNKNSLLFLLLA